VANDRELDDRPIHRRNQFQGIDEPSQKSKSKRDEEEREHDGKSDDKKMKIEAEGGTHHRRLTVEEWARNRDSERAVLGVQMSHIEAQIAGITVQV
jgi:hypothetical protein